jgi:hypothetical protein
MTSILVSCDGFRTSDALVLRRVKGSVVEVAKRQNGIMQLWGLGTRHGRKSACVEAHLSRSAVTHSWALMYVHRLILYRLPFDSADRFWFGLNWKRLPHCRLQVQIESAEVHVEDIS